MTSEQYNKIYILGDLHGQYEILLKICRLMPEKSLIVQVGDWGLGFSVGQYQIAILKECKNILHKKQSNVYVIRGNHDNPSMFPQIQENIHFLKDYAYKTINNQTWLFVGGATSIDRDMRTQGISWWPNEIVEYAPEKINQKCDVLILHSSPESCFPHDSERNLRKIIDRYVPPIPALKEEMYKDLVTERHKLERVFKKSQPSKLFYGHFHLSNKERIGNCETQLLDINKWVEL